MQIGTMTLSNVVAMGFREDKKNGSISVELAYTGGKETVKLLNNSQKESIPLGKYGTAVIQMIPKQSVQEYKDTQFISNSWRSEFLLDFKAGNK